MDKKLKFEVNDLKRLFMDFQGLSDLSFDDVAELNEKGKHIYPDLKKYYYDTREENIEEYYKRFAKWFNLRKELGLIHVKDGLWSPKNRVLNMSKYALDNGAMSLHYYAFLPAVELLASEE